MRLRLRAGRYDVVVDSQGLLKSAMVAACAPGMRAGLDWKSSREPLRMFYHRTFSVPWGQHAVERNRKLAAQALGYALDTPARYGVTAPPLSSPARWAAPGGQGYAVLLHATSTEDKFWPEQHWIDLGLQLGRQGIAAILPWGNDSEGARSHRLARLIPHAIVPPRLALREVAALLGHAQIVFGVDTGLTHLAAALGTPTVGIYMSTDPTATGLYGAPRARNLGGLGEHPTLAQVLAAGRDLLDATQRA
jgi:heptosyltransferase I